MLIVLGNSIMVEGMEKKRADDQLTNPVTQRLGYRLRRASSAMMANLGAALEAIGLRPVEATIIMLIGANPDCIQSDIGRTLGIKRANMVPLITALTQRDLVRKSPVDGRSVALSLTPLGEEACARANRIMTAHEQRYEERLTPEIRQALQDALDILEREEPGATA